MTVLRRPATMTTPTRTCTICHVTAHGDADIIATFYYNDTHKRFESYCKWCWQMTDDLQHEFPPGTKGLYDRLHKEYGAGMVRICRAAGIKQRALARLIAADMQ